MTPPVISFEAIFEQSNPFSPIIFILSPGSDPASDLMKLAERSGFGGNKLKFLAMGQGQEKVKTEFFVGNDGYFVYNGRIIIFLLACLQPLVRFLLILNGQSSVVC